MLVTGIERNGWVRTQLCSIAFICIYDIYHPKGPWYMSAWRTLYLKETQMRVDQQFIWEPDLSRSVWIHESKFPVLGFICKPLECALPSTQLCLEKAAVLEKTRSQLSSCLLSTASRTWHSRFRTNATPVKGVWWSVGWWYWAYPFGSWGNEPKGTFIWDPFELLLRSTLDQVISK